SPVVDGARRIIVPCEVETEVFVFRAENVETTIGGDVEHATDVTAGPLEFPVTGGLDRAFGAEFLGAGAQDVGAEFDGAFSRDGGRARHTQAANAGEAARSRRDRT